MPFYIYTKALERKLLCVLCVCQPLFTCIAIIFGEDNNLMQGSLSPLAHNMVEASRSNSSTPSEDGSVMDVGKRGPKNSLQRRILPVNELVESKENAEWTIFSATQNLPAALNDPTRRETDLFTRTWGDSFVAHAPILPSSALPSIELPDFLRYLKETAAVRIMMAVWGG